MTKNWKIYFCALAVIFLSSCGFSDKESEPPGTVHYYQFSLPHFRETFSDLIAVFKKSNPDVNIKLHTLPSTTDDQHQFYLTHLSGKGKSRIDVLAVDVIWMSEFAKAGFLIPVDSIYSEEEWKEFFPSSVESSKFKNQRYAVPLFIDGGALYSRSDLLEKYGYDHPPETWEELVSMAQNILLGEKDPELSGFVWQGKQYEGLICNFIEFLPEKFNLIHSGDGTFKNFDRPEVASAINFMRDLVYKYRVSPESVFSMSEEESRHAFQNGRAVFMRNWPYAWRLTQQEGSKVKGKTQVSLLPAVKGDAKGKGALGGFLLGINKNSPYPDAAGEWVKFLASEPAQKILSEKLGLTPARKSVFSKLSRSEKFSVTLLKEIMDRTVARPVTPLYIPVSQSMQAYISGALAGVYTVDQSIKRMESDSTRIMRIVQ